MVPSLVYHPVGGRHPITEQSGRFTKKITPGWRDHRARYTDANVQPLDGYTSPGTPCLMDEPQMKPCTSLGGSSWHPRHPRQPRQLDSLDSARQSRQQRSTITVSTVSTVSTVLSSCQARHSLDTPSTLVDTCRHLSTVSTVSTARAQHTARSLSLIHSSEPTRPY